MSLFRNEHFKVFFLIAIIDRIESNMTTWLCCCWSYKLLQLPKWNGKDSVVSLQQQKTATNLINYCKVCLKFEEIYISARPNEFSVILFVWPYHLLSNIGSRQICMMMRTWDFWLHLPLTIVSCWVSSFWIRRSLWCSWLLSNVWIYIYRWWSNRGGCCNFSNFF